MSVESKYENRDELLSHWQIQEGLLQNYRALFLTTQSIIISIASTNECKSVFILMGILGIILLWLWLTICWARGLDVSYFQWQLIKAEKEKVDNIMTNFKKWQGKKIHEKECELPIEIKKSKTRCKMELFLPLLFLALWIFLFAFKF